MVRTVAVERVQVDPDVWPQEALDDKRVADFVALLRDDHAALPPLTVIEQGGSFRLADGHHRLNAHLDLSHEQVEVEVVQPHPGEDVRGALLRIGIETAARSSLPLTRAGRRRAVRLLAALGGMTQDEIGRKVGVSQKTVSRWLSQMTAPAAISPNDDADDPRAKVARRLVNSVLALADAEAVSASDIAEELWAKTDEAAEVARWAGATLVDAAGLIERYYVKDEDQAGDEADSDGQPVSFLARVLGGGRP